MRERTTRGILAAACLAAACCCLGADAPKQDSVTFRDKTSGKEVTKTAAAGAIQAETPEAFQFKTASGVLDIQEKDLVSVTHGDAPAEFQQAEEARQEGDYARAADLYQLALKAAGVGEWIQHDARWGRGDSLYRQGNLKEAAAVLAEVAATPVTKGRFRWMAQVRLAQCQIFQREYDPAKATLETLKSPLGNWGDIARELWQARILEIQKDYNGAAQAYASVATRAGARQPDLKDQALARAQICKTALGEAQAALTALQPLVDQAQPEKVGGAALNAAAGAACLALAKAAKDPAEQKKLAFKGAMFFLHGPVVTETSPEEAAAGLLGAEQCFTLAGDAANAQKMREDRKSRYGDSFVGS